MAVSVQLGFKNWKSECCIIFLQCIWLARNSLQQKDCFSHGFLRSSGTVLLKGLLLDQVSLDHKNIIFISSNEDKFHGAFSVQYSDG